MSINHTISFGFSEDDSVNLESVKMMFKRRIIEENISLEDLSNHGMYVLKSISKNFGNSTLDKVFKKSIESLSQKHQTNQEEYLELRIFGFKATTHLRFLRTIEQKLSVKMKRQDYRNFGTSGRRCSRSPLGGRLATMLVATISAVIFFFFFFSPSSIFLIEGVLGSKNLFSESCLKWPIT